MFLETQRLILRKLEETDFPDFCAFAMDDEMCLMMGRALMPDEAAARENFDWLKDREPRGYALVLKETGRVIGNLTVAKVSDWLMKRDELQGKRGVTLSFSIGRNYQRRGLMFEAVSAVLDRLLNDEHVDFVNCGYFDFNTASRELQRKLGFEYFLAVRAIVFGEERIIIENIIWNESKSY